MIEYILEFLGFAAVNIHQKKDAKPSIGQKILPLKYKQNKNAILVANIFVWVSIVALIAAIVAWLS